MLSVIAGLVAELTEEHEELRRYNACPAKSPLCLHLIQQSILSTEAELYRWLHVDRTPLVVGRLLIQTDDEGAIRYHRLDGRSCYGWYGAPESCN